MKIEACNGCVACCAGDANPFFNDQELKVLPPELKEEALASCLCAWAKLGVGCKHYEWRPGVCRRVVVGGPLCLTMRRKYPELTGESNGDHSDSD